MKQLTISALAFASTLVFSQEKKNTLLIKEIDQVVIDGKKNVYKSEKGNLIVDVQNSQLAKVATTSDLLVKIPYLQMDSNGEGLSVVGKGGPLLYIDNQRVDFSTVSALQVDDIKSVEIIRNPSAKYEAEGKAVVKIILKNSKKEGYRIALAETATFNKRFRNDFSLNYQQKKGKTEWKLNAAYNQIQHWESNGFEYAVPYKNISSDYTIKSLTSRPQTVFGASIYQQLKDDDYLTFSFSSNMRPDKGVNTTVTDYIDNGIATHVLTENPQDSKRVNLNSVFNYSKQVKPLDLMVFTGLQFTRESRKVDYDFYNNINNTGSNFIQHRNNHYSVNAYAGKIDLEKKFKGGCTLAAGASLSSAEAYTDNITNYRTANPQELFKYFLREDNVRSYAELNAEKEKFNFKGGVRMEATSAKGTSQISGVSNIEKNYTDWFPNGELSYKHNKDHIYTANFQRTISRPSYSDLSSGGLYSSPYVEYVGNQNLIPAYTNTFSLSANVKKWSVNASLYHTKNPMGFGLFYDEATNISRFTVKNFAKEMGASVSLDVPFEYRILSSQNSVSINYSKISDSLASIGKSIPYLYLYTNNSLKLGKGFHFLADGTWISKRTTGIFEYNDMLLVNLGISKSFKYFDFTLRCNDVFNQNTYIQKLTYDKITTKGSFYGNTPSFSVGIKYNLGKISDSKLNEKPVNQNAGRI